VCLVCLVCLVCVCVCVCVCVKYILGTSSRIEYILWNQFLQTSFAWSPTSSALKFSKINPPKQNQYTNKHLKMNS
jgi:hypothetical protein